MNTESSLESPHHRRGHRSVGLCLLSAGSKGQARPRPEGRRSSGVTRPDRRRAEARDRPHRSDGSGRRWTWPAFATRSSSRSAARSFRVEGVQDDAAFRAKAVETADAVFNRSRRAREAPTRSTMKPNIANALRDEAVTQALQTIERRVNELGVAEPIVTRQGSRDQILVQLPGVEDVRRAKELISSTALLELKLVDQGPFPTREDALKQQCAGRCRGTPWPHRGRRRGNQHQHRVSTS